MKVYKITFKHTINSESGKATEHAFSRYYKDLNKAKLALIGEYKAENILVTDWKQYGDLYQPIYKGYAGVDFKCSHYPAHITTIQVD